MKRALIAIALLAACGRKASELQLVDIKRGDLVIGVVVTGELEAVDSTDIKPPPLDIWNFKIASLADDGAEVKAGEPVVGFKDRSVDVHIVRLRRKLAAACPDFTYIHTHHSIGYRFEPEPNEVAVS